MPRLPALFIECIYRCLRGDRIIDCSRRDGQYGAVALIIRLRNMSAPSSQQTIEQPGGYAALARLMGPYRDMVQFSRLSRLNTYSLLVQQAELLKLERDLEITLGVDVNATYQKVARDITSDSESYEANLVLEIREKLKEYSKAFTSHSTDF
jgi:hypothetical protein